MKTGLAGLAVCVVALFCILSAGAVGAPSTVVSIPSRLWIGYYIQAIKKVRRDEASLTLRFPQIYLYGPHGNPVAFVQSPQKLKGILAQIPIHTPRGAVAQHPLRLVTQLHLLRESGARKLANPPPGKWTMLFFRLSDSPAANKLAQILKGTPKNVASKLYIIWVNLQPESIPSDKDNPKN